MSIRGYSRRRDEKKKAREKKSPKSKNFDNQMSLPFFFDMIILFFYKTKQIASTQINQTSQESGNWRQSTQPMANTGFKITVKARTIN